MYWYLSLKSLCHWGRALIWRWKMVLMLLRNCFTWLATPWMLMQHISPLWFIGNIGSKMCVCVKLLCLALLTGPGKDFTVDGNRRAWVCSFMELCVCLLSDRIITHEAKWGSQWVWWVIAVDVEGILMVQQRQRNVSEASSLCSSPCFICLRLPPPLCGEASSLEDSKVTGWRSGPQHEGF